MKIPNAELFDIPVVGKVPIEAPPEDASLTEVRSVLMASGISDVRELVVPPNDVRLQRPSRELQPEEVESPMVRFGDQVLRLVAGQEPGDKIGEDKTTIPLPRLIGLADVQVWTPRPHLEREDSTQITRWGPVQMTLIPDAHRPITRGTQPHLVTALNLTITAQSTDSVWSFEGCYSDSIPDADKPFVLIRHPRWVEYEYVGMDGDRIEERVDDDAHVGPVVHEERHVRGQRPGDVVFQDVQLVSVPSDRPELLDVLRDFTGDPEKMASPELPRLGVPLFPRWKYEHLTATGSYAGTAINRETAHIAKLRDAGRGL